ncbi:MAG: acylphosphatase [Anaerolineales bacterium]|nr:acylphosphatase [Anaerolineales bacterium]
MGQEESLQARLHAIVEGRVQGVGFRYFVEESAMALGLTGWVRNRWDGTVELVAEGERQSLEKLLAVVRRGPRASYVSDVRFEWSPASGEFKSFYVRITSN